MITKLFKNTDAVISLRTKNNVKHHLGIKRSTTDKYNLSFAQHIIETGHEYETIEKTIKILHIKRKVKY
jgi:ABC-type transport system involved in cytochrome c biogenesis ATPase subunit